MKDNIKEEIRKELAMYNLTEDDLTPDELKSLEEEIEAKKKGYLILDGVLSDTKILYRPLRRETEKERLKKMNEDAGHDTTNEM